MKTLLKVISVLLIASVQHGYCSLFGSIFSNNNEQMVIKTPFTVNIETDKEIKLKKIMGVFIATKYNKECSEASSFTPWRSADKMRMELNVTQIDNDTFTFTIPEIEDNSCKFKMDSFYLVLEDESQDTEVPISSMYSRIFNYEFNQYKNSTVPYTPVFHIQCKYDFTPTVVGQQGLILETLSQELIDYHVGDDGIRRYTLHDVYSFECFGKESSNLKKGQSELTLKIQ